MVTLIGFFFIIVQYAFIAYYHPKLDGTEAAPSWVYYLQAAHIWVYQTMVSDFFLTAQDALDGKQARRTGTSSPLGELFDHGCDAMTTAFLVLVAAAATGMSTTSFLLPTMLVACIVFFMAQWEEYNTDAFILGPINVTEAQYTIIGICIWTGIVGPRWWHQEVTVAGFTLAYNDILSLFNISIQGLTALGNLYKGYLTALPSKKAGRLARLLPIISLAGGALLWTRNSDILRSYPHEFCIMVGFLSAGIVGRIVVARVCELQLSWFQPILLPYLLGAANAAYFKIWSPNDLSYLYFCLVLSIGAYLDFALGVIEQMTEHLKIRCLHLYHSTLSRPRTLKLRGQKLLQFPTLSSAPSATTADSVTVTHTIRANKEAPLFGYAAGNWVLLETADGKKVLTEE